MGAVITWLGGGLSDGAQGLDIGAIPGMLNFQLKNDRAGGSVQVKQGRHFDGEDFLDGSDRSWGGHGNAVAVAGNFGVPLGESGFANVSVEYGNQEPTDRAIQRNDAAGLVAAGNTAVWTPTAQVWGSPRVSDDLKEFSTINRNRIW